MTGRKLREALLNSAAEPATLAAALLQATQGAALQELQDAFTVALGTALLTPAQAQALLAALRADTAPPSDPELAVLQQEVQDLETQAQALGPEQQQRRTLLARQAELQAALAQLQTQLTQTADEQARLQTLEGALAS